jgi:hypothetical protein
MAKQVPERAVKTILPNGDIVLMSRREEKRWRKLLNAVKTMITAKGSRDGKTSKV